LLSVIAHTCNCTTEVTVDVRKVEQKGKKENERKKKKKQEAKERNTSTRV